MATAIVAFRWLEMLESDFDKAYVEIDGIIPEIDCDEVELIDLAKSKLTTLSSAFAQLVHKAQTIFQNNAKLEAQVLDYRDKLADCRCQIDTEDPSDISSLERMKRLERKCELLQQENTALTHELLSLQGEVYGARLASQYLDKELAGRIQQLQLLTQPKMNLNAQHKLWKQIESEIFLHRHKTVSRACRGQGQKTQQPSSKRPKELRAENSSHEVKLNRRKGESLGISVTGGSENGLPILVSKIHPGSVSDQSALLSAGDSLLAVNSTDLRGSSLSNAVRVLSEVNGEFTLHLYNSLSDEEELHGSELQVEYCSTTQVSVLLKPGLPEDTGTLLLYFHQYMKHARLQLFSGGGSTFSADAAAEYLRTVVGRLDSVSTEYPIFGEDVGYKPSHMSLDKLNSLTCKSTESIDLKPTSDSKTRKPAQSLTPTAETNGIGNTTGTTNRAASGSSDTTPTASTSNFNPTPATTANDSSSNSSQSTRQNVGQYTLASVQSLEDNQNPVFNSHQ